jgi:hypothetical protein
MTLTEIQNELPKLSADEKAHIAAQCFQELTSPQSIALLQRCTEIAGDALGDHKKSVQRLLRRLEHPEVPEDFWLGLEDSEDGRDIDMETALFEKPPEPAK